MLDIPKSVLSSRLMHRALRQRAFCTIVSCELQACTRAVMSALRTTAPYRRHRVGSANYGSVPTSPCRPCELHACADVIVSATTSVS
ncbi:unnamed protein product [Cochlearia groenlandica]